MAVTTSLAVKGHYFLFSSVDSKIQTELFPHPVYDTPSGRVFYWSRETCWHAMTSSALPGYLAAVVTGLDVRLLRTEQT